MIFFFLISVSKSCGANYNKFPSFQKLGGGPVPPVPSIIYAGNIFLFLCNFKNLVAIRYKELLCPAANRGPVTKFVV